MSDIYTNIQSNGANVRVNIFKKSITFFITKLLWIINPLLVKKYVLRGFFVPRLYLASDAEKELLQEAESLRLMVNDQYVSCWKWGSGPAIVYVHGWNGSGIQFYPFIKESLARGYSVIAFDGPGHGESDGNTSSYFQMTDALRALLNHYSKDEIVAIVGHSFGAAAIINALHKDQHRLPAVLIAPALGIREMLDLAFQIHGVPKNIHQQLIYEYETRYGYNLKSDNPMSLLHEYQLQALIIHDKQDKVTPIEESESASAKFDSIDLFATTGLGHKRVLSDRDVMSEMFRYLQGQVVEKKVLF